MKPEIASDADTIARLNREAQTTTGLGHPNIVDTYSKVPTPPSESAADRGVSAELEALILRCLAKDPAS